MIELQAFVKEQRDSRELKRGLAVLMTLQGYVHRQIIDTLQIKSSFISKWKKIYLEKGIEGLKLQYQGSKGLLSPEEKDEVTKWLQQNSTWNLCELECHLVETYDVAFAAKSSYYELFEAAGISWKKSQRSNPRKDPTQVAEKKRDHRVARSPSAGNRIWEANRIFCR